MKRTQLFVPLVVLALLVGGCAGFARKSTATSYARPPRAFALAVTVNGVLQPTPQQWAAIQAKFADVLAAQGAILVTDLSLADKIIRIDFTPDPTDPENRGHARVIAMRDNPLHILASTTRVGRYPTAFGYAGSFQSALWGYGGFSNSYYGWRDTFYDGYSYGSGNLNPVSPPVVTRPTTPHRPHHGNHDDCPPDRYIRSVPRFAGDYGSTPANNFPPTRSGGRDRWSGGDGSPSSSTYASTSDRTRPERAWSRSSSGDSGSERTWSRGNSSGSSSGSERSWSRGSSRDPGSERTYTRSENSSWRSGGRTSPGSENSSWRSRSESSGSYSRSEPSYSRSEPSHSSSSSYSSPSYSSSSGGSSSSYSSSSGSSGGGSASYSSGGSSGGAGTTSSNVQPH